MVVSGLAAVGMGLARGSTVEVFERNGVAWQRARWATLGMWVASIAARLGLVLLAHAAGAPIAASMSALPLLLGLTLLGQNLLIMARARQAALPLLPTPGTWGSSGP
jgi:hypothetical protein